MRASYVALAWLALGPLSPATAWGQSDASVAEARSLFEEGLAAMERGRHADAVELFDRSLVHAERPSTAYNLVLALRATGKLVRASSVGAELLNRRYGDIEPEQRTEVRTVLDEMRVEIGTLVVRVSGADRVEIRVDEDGVVGDVGEGATLERPIDPGTHLIVGSAPDRADAEARVRVAAGERVEIALRLTALDDDRPGTLLLESTHDDTTLEVVGFGRARSMLEQVLTPGEYVVRVSGPGGARETTVEVPAGRRLRLVLDPPQRSSLVSNPVFWLVTIGLTLAVGGLVTGLVLAFVPRNEIPLRGDEAWGVVEVP